MRHLKRILTIIFALVIITLSLFNRQAVELVWSMSGDSVSVPLYLVLFLGIFVGLLTVILTTSWQRLKNFTAKRQADRRVEALEQQVVNMSEELGRLKTQETQDQIRIADGTKSETGLVSKGPSL